MSDNKQLFILITALIGSLVLASLASGQTGKPQTGYVPPFEPEDPIQHTNNLDFATQFKLKKHQITTQKPGDAMRPGETAVQEDGTNVIFWYKASDSIMWGIELSTYPLTKDQ